jgi:glycyl-tRNA synthetase
LIEYNNGKMPCAGATIGMGFRNEINPRQGLLRVREFALAEIEHFVDPLDKSHHKFDMIKDEILPLWTKGAQEVMGEVRSDLTLGQAVEQGIVGN